MRSSYMQKNLSSSFPSASSSSWFEVYAAISTFMMLLRTSLNDLIPRQIRSFVISKLKSFFSERQLQHNHEVSLHINQFWDRQTNQLFQAAQEYLPDRITHSYRSLKVGKLMQHKNIVVALDGKQEVVDQFEDIKLLEWKLVESSKEDSDHHPKSNEKHSLTLTFDEKHREKIMNKYIPHVLSTYQAMQVAKRTIKIHSMGGGSRHCWQKREVLDRSTTKESDEESDYEHKPVKVNTKKFTLSGLLNYMDGLWFSGGEERIIIFTTNHRERIDPALLRPGRMDMHIHLSFLKGMAFQALASNYLGIEGYHPLFEQIKELLEKIEVTPAVVAEQLMRNEDPDVALEALVKFLKEMDKEKACI
ncbi:hypothetical protein JHK82_048541 [Glycine max]|nr:hypothetical protein JHK86_048396 [Glycine max]KAG5098687.1 hypothetical protein JHK82_048541 [Glycine max]